MPKLRVQFLRQDENAEVFNVLDRKMCFCYFGLLQEPFQTTRDGVWGGLRLVWTTFGEALGQSWHIFRIRGSRIKHYLANQPKAGIAHECDKFSAKFIICVLGAPSKFHGRIEVDKHVDFAGWVVGGGWWFIIAQGLKFEYWIMRIHTPTGCGCTGPKLRNSTV